MNGNQLSAGTMFSTMLAVLVATGCAYFFSVPVSNNFELDPYFLYTMLVPGLVTALVTGFLARLVGTRVMTLACVAWVAAMLVACAVVASDFETNAERSQGCWI
jgi:Na+/melibiose symporter-like transporter